MTNNIILPSKPLSEVESDFEKEVLTEFNISNLNIEDMDNCERNRLFTLYSNTQGNHPKEIANFIEDWKIRANGREKGDNTDQKTDGNDLPRSKLVDAFFSHRLPGVKDTILDDIRKITKLHMRLERFAKLGIEQTNVGLHRLNSILPELCVFNEESKIKYSEQVGAKYGTDDAFKPIQPLSKNASATISLLLENLSGITADYTSGLRIENK